MSHLKKIEININSLKNDHKEFIKAIIKINKNTAKI